MDLFEIAADDLVLLYRDARLGKLMGGLIHNLNGPLHGLGIEMDLTNHVLQKGGRPTPEILDTLDARLKRMDEEYENINRLIRMVVSRADPSYMPAMVDLNGLLAEEFEFMKANLYFKHNVATDILPDKGLPLLNRPPEALLLGIQWLIQALVDELERHDVRSLRVTTRALESGWAVEFLTEKDGLPETFAEGLSPRADTAEHRHVRQKDVGMVLSASLLRQSGALLERDPEPPRCRITLCVTGG